MRMDLGKSLTERARDGAGTFKTVRRRKGFSFNGTDPELLPEHETMTMRHMSRREGREHLAPLKGLLRKYVGKPWNTFHSDLCKTLGHEDRLIRTALRRIDWLCERDLKVVDDKLYLIGMGLRGAGSTAVSVEKCGRSYYVDPRDGLLKANSRRPTKASYRRHAREREASRLDAIYRKLDQQSVLIKLQDIWYVLKHAPIPKDHEMFLMDALTGQEFHNTMPVPRLQFEGVRLPDYLGTTRYHVSKRTASHRQLKAVGLVS